MMHISVRGEYALMALFDLGSRWNGRPIKIADVAKRQRIPQKFLELILASLKQGGFVESRRGADGGYMLARPADAISVGQVLRFVEGPREGKARSRQKGDSPFVEMWGKVDQAISGVVDHTTLADLARAWQERRSQFVPNWEI